MRVVLAGGGTGGHVIPALAIARELQSRYGAEVLFIGTPRGIENQLVPAAGFELRLIQVGALKYVSLARRLRTLADLPRAIFAGWKLLKEFHADVVIGVGGYASGPAMLAAGITAMVVLQALMNISVVLALMPTKGIPLPFISYGGSSLFVTLASVGVLLNITQHTD